MRIGIHTSTSGRLVNAAVKAKELGANCFQIFSASPRMWRAVMPPREQTDEMRTYREEHGLAPLVIHDSYLINLAAPDEEIRRKSVAAIRDELLRAAAIGAEYLVMHPGSAKDDTVERGIGRIADSLEEAARELEVSGVTLLFENTAGAGATIGRTLEELTELRSKVEGRVPFGVGFCLDTCHLYASGFDIATEKGLNETLADAGRILGLERIPVIHVNDSKGPLASRLDRHANIGEGHIGLEGFRRILNHPDLAEKAFVLETPIDQPGDDQRNVDALKSLCRKRRTTTRKSS
ncbi:MAG: deoxyribonuclease IV [Acidobacteria bacterium]|nr:deoxyribonuclease IV [Acidobacteriota bacterium]